MFYVSSLGLQLRNPALLYAKTVLNLLTYIQSMYLDKFGSVLFFSRPRSEGWYFLHLSLSSVILTNFHGESCPRLDIVHPLD